MGPEDRPPGAWPGKSPLRASRDREAEGEALSGVLIGRVAGSASSLHAIAWAARDAEVRNLDLRPEPVHRTDSRQHDDRARRTRRVPRGRRTGNRGTDRASGAGRGRTAHRGDKRPVRLRVGVTRTARTSQRCTRGQPGTPRCLLPRTRMRMEYPTAAHEARPTAIARTLPTVISNRTLPCLAVQPPLRCARPVCSASVARSGPPRSLPHAQTGAGSDTGTSRRAAPAMSPWDSEDPRPATAAARSLPEGGVTMRCWSACSGAPVTLVPVSAKVGVRRTPHLNVPFSRRRCHGPWA